MYFSLKEPGTYVRYLFFNNNKKKNQSKNFNNKNNIITVVNHVRDITVYAQTCDVIDVFPVYSGWCNFSVIRCMCSVHI